MTNHINTKLQAAKAVERNLVPFQAGWALDAAGRLDAHRPGFLAHLLRSKPNCRQAIFVAMSMGILDDPAGFVGKVTGEPGNGETDLARVAELLMEMSPQCLLYATVGVVPALAGALRRVGFQPLEPDAYTRFVAILTGRSHEHSLRRRALTYCGEINSNRLAVIDILHPSLLHVNMAPKVRCAEHAEFANTIVELVLEYSSATPASIAQAVSDSNGRFSVSSFLTELLLKNVDRLPEPPFVTDSAVLRPLRSPKEFRETGARFRNCLATKAVSHALTGRAAFYEFQGKAIAVVIRTQDGWVLGRVHMERNGSPDPEIVGQVRDAFTAAGVKCLLPYVPEGRMAAVAELFDPLGATVFYLDADAWAEDV